MAFVPECTGFETTVPLQEHALQFTSPLSKPGF
jgi:hypothetical protein